jgi:hypothetical protein
MPQAPICQHHCQSQTRVNTCKMHAISAVRYSYLTRCTALNHSNRTRNFNESPCTQKQSSRASCIGQGQGSAKPLQLNPRQRKQYDDSSQPQPATRTPCNLKRTKASFPETLCNLDPSQPAARVVTQHIVSSERPPLQPSHTASLSVRSTASAFTR